jgi:hypothetical protein
MFTKAPFVLGYAAIELKAGEGPGFSTPKPSHRCPLLALEDHVTASLGLDAGNVRPLAVLGTVGVSLLLRGKW